MWIIPNIRFFFLVLLEWQKEGDGRMGSNYEKSLYKEYELV